MAVVNKKNSIIISLALLITTGMVLGAYNIGYQKGKTEAPPPVPPSPTPNLDAILRPQGNDVEINRPPEESPVTRAQTRLALERALDQNNYESLVPVLADQVTLTVAGTECCGNLPAESAATQLQYLNSAVKPWDFDDTHPLITQIKNTYPAKYQGSVLGISPNNYLMAVWLNSENKILRIEIAANVNLILVQ